MRSARALFAAALLCGAARADVAPQDVLYEISDEQYYSMPRLFHLDEYQACLAPGGVYCLGSFELTPLSPHHPLFQLMERYSANWVDNFNHTRLHRGLCISRRCARLSHDGATGDVSRRQSRDLQQTHQSLDAWFTSCVNTSTVSAYNLSARLYRLEYCRRGAAGAAAPLSASERAFAGVLAALLALAIISTVLDLSLSDHIKKECGWALAWSLPGCWRALQAPPPAADRTDLAGFDGLRVLGMLCIIIEHVCWLNTLSYLVETRSVEQTRRASDVVLMTNSTLVVQLFFIMSSFLLAHKLLSQQRRGNTVPILSTFVETMFNRFIRMSPSYFIVLWFAASWWQRLGDGPMWEALVGSEAAVCRHKWWTHLLYLNNIIYPDDKCLIQTWYLAADMQLYALALLLTLALLRWRRAALGVLGALSALSVGAVFALAYYWRLVPTFVLHRPESIRALYAGEPSFNVLYQSPLGNVPGALAGLLLAHAHHSLLDHGVCLNDYKWVRWVGGAAPLLALWWTALSPLALTARPPALAAAALAALERPVFVLLVCAALLPAMQGVRSPTRALLSWRGWRVLARLTFGALMLHMLIDKSLVAARHTPAQLDRQTAILEWFGVAVVSYLAALPLALLVELPAQRLQRALRARAPAQPPPQGKDRT